MINIYILNLCCAKDINRQFFQSYLDINCIRGNKRLIYFLSFQETFYFSAVSNAHPSFVTFKLMNPGSCGERHYIQTAVLAALKIST